MTFEHQPKRSRNIRPNARLRDCIYQKEDEDNLYICVIDGIQLQNPFLQNLRNRF